MLINVTVKNKLDCVNFDRNNSFNNKLTFIGLRVSDVQAWSSHT